jgi:3-hydroxybutyryl-CoA dehydrogenase
VSGPPGRGGAPALIGVVGAGTMGAGIAELACLAGARTLLHDPLGEALEKGVDGIRAQLDRGVERGRLTEAQARAAAGRLEAAPGLDALALCGLVIEAAPESLELKHELFARLSGLVAPDAVLATNTSSLPVTAIAAAATGPERVVGMHFFNPAPVMALLEVVAGEDSSEPALALARATGEAMGKRVIVAADGPGFLVNRCNRPFGLEALRLLQERLAPVETVDRALRLGGGFRMGPFELMDLVGLDTGLDVARSFYELSFGEPRWRPSPITARLVAAGRRGRKSGRGYYRYDDDGPHRPEDPEPPASGGGGGLVLIAGDGVLAHDLHELAAGAGYDAAWAGERPGEVPELIVDARLGDEEEIPLEGGPRVVLCAAGSLAALDPEGTATGFHALAPLADSRLVELTRTDTTADAAAEAAERFFAALGKHVEWVGDAPGLVLGRVVCQVVNECAFALAEGVGSTDDIDAGMVLGLNHQRGPLAWADAIGLDHVLAVLDALADEYREERYRAAPLLRRLVWQGRLGAQTGAGFHEHEE